MSTAKPAAKPATKARKATAVAAATDKPVTTADTTAEAKQEPEKLTPATDVAASGAMIEPEIVERIDTANPAVDHNPRAGLPAESNRIDFNDPHMSGSEAVEKALAAKDQF